MRNKMLFNNKKNTMDRVIFAHFYASASFFAAKISFAYWNDVPVVGIQGLGTAIAFYAISMGYQSFHDVQLKKSLYTVYEIVQNKALDAYRGPSKNKHKAVRKMKRLQKKNVPDIDKHLEKLNMSEKQLFRS